jgi:hypothetical protein
MTMRLITPPSNDESVTATPDSNLIPPLVSPLEERATCFFFKNYVLMQGTTQGHMDYLPALVAEIPRSEALCAAVSAVGTAGIAIARRSSEAMTLARSRYGSALKLTNAALADCVQCKPDHSLMAVLILALYEVG